MSETGDPSDGRLSITGWRRERCCRGNDEVARTWGELAGYATKRGRPRPVNDTWVAACSLTFGLPLATLNARDFQDFAGHEGLVLVQA